MALSNQAKKGPDLEPNSKIAENIEQNSMCMSNISHSDVVNREPFSAVLMKQQPSKGILKNSPSRADSISETHSDASMGDKTISTRINMPDNAVNPGRKTPVVKQLRLNLDAQVQPYFENQVLLSKKSSSIKAKRESKQPTLDSTNMIKSLTSENDTSKTLDARKSGTRWKDASDKEAASTEKDSVNHSRSSSKMEDVSAKLGNNTTDQEQIDNEMDSHCQEEDHQNDTGEEDDEMMEEEEEEEEDPMTAEERKALYEAVCSGDIDRVERLLDKPNADINMVWFSESLLVAAIRFGHEEMAEFLLDNGVDPNFVATRIEEAETNDPTGAKYRWYTIPCRQLAYDADMLDVVELIDVINGELFSFIKPREREPRIRRRFSENKETKDENEERDSACGMDEELDNVFDSVENPSQGTLTRMSGILDDGYGTLSPSPRESPIYRKPSKYKYQNTKAFLSRRKISKFRHNCASNIGVAPTSTTPVVSSIGSYSFERKLWAADTRTLNDYKTSTITNRIDQNSLKILEDRISDKSILTVSPKMKKDFAGKSIMKKTNIQQESRRSQSSFNNHATQPEWSQRHVTRRSKSTGTYEPHSCSSFFEESRRLLHRQTNSPPVIKATKDAKPSVFDRLYYGSSHTTKGFQRVK